jgi:hypothetical protein
MKGIEFKGQTKVMGKPANMTDDECYGLPVQETKNGNYPVLESVWELTDEDLKIITESKRIRLGIVGVGMPPVYLLPEPKEII